MPKRKLLYTSTELVVHLHGYVPMFVPDYRFRSRKLHRRDSCTRICGICSSYSFEKQGRRANKTAGRLGDERYVQVTRNT